MDRRPLGFIPDVLVGRREGRLKGIEMPALVKQSPHVEWKRACRRLFPDGTVHGRLARSIHGQARRWVGNRNLKRILDETRDRKGIVIYPPLIDWSWMRQRPQQLMIEFAKAGYLSLFCSQYAGRTRSRVSNGSANDCICATTSNGCTIFRIPFC